MNDTATSSKRIRLTISVSPEVHSTFSRLAAASGSSISWAMGEWLSDTLEASNYMTQVVERAKTQPALVVNHLHGMLGEAQGQTAELLRVIAQRDKKTAGQTADGRRSRPAAGRAAVNPPPSNTGGKGPGKGKGKPA